MPTKLEWEHLRASIATLEGGGATGTTDAATLGVETVDAALPWGGLPRGCLHEVQPSRHGDGIEDGAAVAFAAFALARLGQPGGQPLLWIAAGDEPYAPGLAALGLPPDQLVVVRAWKPAQALWALEEALRCPALGGVLAEIWRLDLTGARRLQLAARNSGVAALLLNRGEAIGSAATRWRVGPQPSNAAPGEGVGPWRWRLDLLRCRGLAGDDRGAVAGWDVEWDDETRGLRLAAAAGNRAAEPVLRPRLAAG